ncbi:MAG: glycosyl hydrolase family 8 [Bacteroidales bacterium]|nr:glycosyl hydrolase family 8 [Bacteroidales bacterium]
MLKIQAQIPTKPFPQHVSYQAGSIKPSVYTQEQLDEIVKNFYTKWKNKYVKSDCGSGQYYVDFDEGNTICVSEGLGYGMMILPLMAGYDANAKTVFDGMYKFYKAHPSSINEYLMAWKQIDGCIDDVSAGIDAASDGDIDIAYGLLLADIQWSSAGSINYFSEAKKIISAILQDEINQQTKTVKLGDWVSSTSSFYYSTRSSDFITDHFRVFACATENTVWNKVVDTCYSLINQMQTKYSVQTGLVPDFIVNTNSSAKPAPPNFLEGDTDGDYSYNSCRVPWRLATDYLLYGDERAKTSVNKINNWIKSNTGNNPDNIKSGYKLDGSTIATWDDAAFVGPFAVGAMIDVEHQAWLDLVFEKLLVYNFTNADYYSNTLKMMSLLILSGNYWAPDCNVLSVGEIRLEESSGLSIKNATDYLEIEISDKYKTDYYEGFMYSVSGANIMNFIIENKITKIDVSVLTPGCYIVKMRNHSNNKLSSFKIMR